MNDCFAMLDDLAEHFIDFIDVILVARAILLARLHYAVP